MAFKLPQGYEEYFKDWEDRIGSFVDFFPDKAPALPADKTGNGPEAALAGLPFGIKENIALEGFSFTCCSKALEGLTAPFTATAVEKLLAAGCVPVGKNNMDEFAMGSTTDTSALKKTNNPWDTNRVPGGSSGGSAATVAAGLVPFSLGSDTGGSVRQPAAFCGVVGLKPTYGAVSRYGLGALASSLDTIGILADSIDRSRRVFGVIRGGDPRDQTSMDAPESAPPLYGSAGEAGGRVIGVLGAAAAEELARRVSGGIDIEAEILEGLETAKTNFAALGYTVKEIDFPALKYAAQAYHVIVSSEASAGLARFDGIRVGKRPAWAENPDDLTDKVRTSGFGDEVKLRVLLGTYALRSGLQELYYVPACRVRDGIRRNFEALLGGVDSKSPPAYDALLFPVYPKRALRRGSLSSVSQKAANLFTCAVNLAGLPAVCFPAGLGGGLPVGVQLIGRAFSEGTLLDIAESYEKAHPFPHPEGYRKFWD